jgi:hypothetical protein
MIPEIHNYPGIRNGCILKPLYRVHTSTGSNKYKVIFIKTVQYARDLSLRHFEMNGICLRSSLIWPQIVFREKDIPRVAREETSHHKSPSSMREREVGYTLNQRTCITISLKILTRRNHENTYARACGITMQTFYGHITGVRLCRFLTSEE